MVPSGAGSGIAFPGHIQSGHGVALTGNNCASKGMVGAAVAGSLWRAPCNLGFIAGVLKVTSQLTILF